MPGAHVACPVLEGTSHRVVVVCWGAKLWSYAICRQEKSGWPVLGLANHVQGKCVHGHLQPFHPKWCEIQRALENGVVVEGCN